MVGRTTKSRSDTMPTTASTTSSLESIPSDKLIVYDLTKNALRKMSKDEYSDLYSDAPYKLIKIPKGASDIHISPDELRFDSSTDFIADVRCQSPDQLDSTESSRISTSRPYSVSYTASVHLPFSVFYTRMINPRKYTDLVVVSHSPTNSQKSSRSATAQLFAEPEE